MLIMQNGVFSDSQQGVATQDTVQGNNGQGDEPDMDTIPSSISHKSAPNS